MDRKRSKKAKSLRAVREENAVKQLQRQVELLQHDKITTLKGLIPAYSPTKLVRCKRRFYCVTNFTGQIAMSEFHSQFLVATSATQASTYVDGWRVRSFKVYARNNEQDYSVQINLTPAGADTVNNFTNAVQKTYAVESQSTAMAMILCIKPRKESPLGAWHVTNTVNSSASLMSISTSSGGSSIDANTVFEIEFEYMVNIYGGLRNFVLTGLSGLVTGTLYGSPLSGGLLLPLDVNNI